MAKVGRPKGINNKEYNYTIRMDEDTKNRREAYCKKLGIAKAEAIRHAIEEMTAGETQENEQP